MEESVKSLARPAASRSLREAVRKARLDEAEQLDRTADARDGEIARLELLKAELETVFSELPSHDDRDRKSTRLNSSHPQLSRMPSSA